MKKTYNIICVAVATLLMLQGCKTEKIEYVTTDGLSGEAVGYLSMDAFDLQVADYAEEITSSSQDPDFVESAGAASATKADQSFGSTEEASGDYVIRIRNIRTSEETELTYDELKRAEDSRIPLAPGTYVVSAESPDYEGYMSGETAASWDSPI